MTNRRRVTIILVSVLTGTLLSALLFKIRRGGQPMTTQDITSLVTNLVFSLGIILGIGFLFAWNKKKDR